jgi:hypothetical protein
MRKGAGDRALFFCSGIKSGAAAADRGHVSTQIGAPVRIVALVGLVAALAVGAWAFAAGGSTGTSSSSAEEAGSVARHPIPAAKSAAAKLSTHNKATAAGKPDVVRTSKPKAATHPRKAKPATSKAGQAPTTIASVLRRHRVAVVLLYDPQSRINSYSLGEAQLGAGQAHAGFLRINVLKQRQALPFAQTYGVMHAPTVLFFARPGKLVQKLVGFADQDTVAQAALNAAHGVVAAQG